MPRQFLNKMKLREKAIGRDRRENFAKEILHKDTPLPKPLEYTDIDASFKDFVSDTLDIAYEGKRLPTFTLFSNQRFSEYSQTWEHVDENRNLLMNFKTISRENNPRFGENQGGLWNIPGERHYTILTKTVLDDNGTESFERYSMKQPYAVDLIYNINLITNKYELINKFNALVNEAFKARQCYIRPNGHFIPMILDEISDESEYSIENRKFFSQTFTIKVMAYIIHEKDFQVESYPKRIMVVYDGDAKKKKPNVDIEELDDINYENKRIDISIDFPEFIETVTFTIDCDVNVEKSTLDNIRYYRLNVNGTPIFPEKGFILKENDEVKLRIFKFDISQPSKLMFHGYDPNIRLKKNYTPELVRDEKSNYEEIIVD